MRRLCLAYLLDPSMDSLIWVDTISALRLVNRVVCPNPHSWPHFTYPVLILRDFCTFSLTAKRPIEKASSLIWSQSDCQANLPFSSSCSVDFGGTGVKAAPVDVTTGELQADRHRIPTPQPATPEAIAGVIKQLVDHFGVSSSTYVLNR